MSDVGRAAFEVAKLLLQECHGGLNLQKSHLMLIILTIAVVLLVIIGMWFRLWWCWFGLWLRFRLWFRLRSWWWVLISWFQFQDKGSVLNIYLAVHEGHVVHVECPIVTRKPSTLIEGIEVVFPGKLEWVVLIRLLRSGPFAFWHIFPVLDEVVAGVPWHAFRLKPVVPVMEIWDPKVHHQVLLSLL
jgi:hypothetical protein